jgi:hypothetical protein
MRGALAEKSVEMKYRMIGEAEGTSLSRCLPPPSSSLGHAQGLKQESASKAESLLKQESSKSHLRDS